MHIKTNIEQNMIQVIVLAVCPLVLVVNSVAQGIFFAVATTVCFCASAFVCGFFNKYFSRNIKIFVTAVISSFIIAIIDIALRAEPKFGLKTNDDCFYAVLATVCLCLDVYYIDSKSVVKLHMIKTLIDCGIFSGILLTLSILVETLGSGKFLGMWIISAKDRVPYLNNYSFFFRTIAFKLIVLGIISIIADSIYRSYQKRQNEKKITYEKYVRKIRDEKMYIYDDLRRKRLLTSKVEINNVKEEFVEEINQKNAENQSIEEDIQESLNKTEDTSDIKAKKKKKQGSKTKLHINVEKQEREKLYAKKAEERAKRERGEIVDDESGKKKGKKEKKGKPKVEKLYGSNSGSNGDKKN